MSRCIESRLLNVARFSSGAASCLRCCPCSAGGINAHREPLIRVRPGPAFDIHNAALVHLHLEVDRLIFQERPPKPHIPLKDTAIRWFRILPAAEIERKPQGRRAIAYLQPFNRLRLRQRQNRPRFHKRFDSPPGDFNADSVVENAGRFDAPVQVVVIHNSPARDGFVRIARGNRWKAEEFLQPFLDRMQFRHPAVEEHGIYLRHRPKFPLPFS